MSDDDAREIQGLRDLMTTPSVLEFPSVPHHTTESRQRMSGGNTIWKFVLSLDPMVVQFTQIKYVPAGARFLHCAEQHQEIALWYEVDPQAEKVQRGFQIFGTGNGPIKDHLAYVGTALLADGALVLHVYETLNPA